MLKIKSFVLVLYFSNIYVSETTYCKICPDHSLCKYEVPGPSQYCMGYDINALLTQEENKAILDKINERRNFVAIGHLRSLPTAANMNKIVWSEELATFAQRWVDQCDQSLRPDKTDQCRNLEYIEVGQNIATVTGSSSHYNVKSFIEMWFMESMDYSYSVTFYNQSRDHKANYFTQLIWAATNKVGCGKAKFFVTNIKPIIVERLVCNFAPKGNVHGKPVYTIGYPATQCKKGMSRDNTFPGLCSHQIELKNGKLPSLNPPATSLLRIRNLFNNDSVKCEIDPIYNNLKHMTRELNGMGDHNREMNDHIYHSTMQAVKHNNISYDAIKRSYPFKNEVIRNSQRSNISRHYGDYLQKRERGHSRVYHGHDHTKDLDFIHPETIYQNARKYDYTTTTQNFYTEQDFRKHNVDEQCTRKSERKLINYDPSECTPCKQKFNKCTRGRNYNCRANYDCPLTPPRCESHEFQTTPHKNAHEFCACNSFSSVYPPSPDRCIQNSNCERSHLNCPTKPCQHMLRTLRDIDDKKLGSDFQYYDILSDTIQLNTQKAFSKPRSIVSNNNPWLTYNKHLKGLGGRKQLQRIYRKKRTASEEEENLKPFWQMDEYENRNQPNLKSLRYTTLSNKKGFKYKSRKSSRASIKTESITIAYKEQNKKGRLITEKYLSFEELMHLRKQNGGDLNNRRFNNERQILRESNATTSKTTEAVTSPSTIKTEVTSEYTFNTPYKRKKYCTRKLTCTWTAASLTDSAGSIIPGGGAGAVGGSRTPPGYVEGCTRTSTCTRDYMNRNKMATLPIETTSPDPEPGDEEDYCERRSLNRRSNNDNSNLGNQSKNVIANFFLNHNKSKLNTSINKCMCNDKNLRNKRHDYNHKLSNFSRYKNLKRENKKHVMYDNNLISYGELYYYVVRKFIETWKTPKSLYSRDKCLCNSINKIMCYNLFFYLIIFLIYYISIYYSFAN